jgi:hypothetical protein
MERRRRLRFRRLDEVATDLEGLVASHRTLGRWSLGQICHLLGLSIRWSMEGYPGPSLPRVAQATLGALMRRGMLRFKFIPRGMPAPRPFQPPADAEAAAEVERLRRAIDEFKAYDGPFVRHPLLGRMTRAQWERFHCIHCAHHLSFVVPGTITKPTA